MALRNFPEHASLGSSLRIDRKPPEHDFGTSAMFFSARPDLPPPSVFPIPMPPPSFFLYQRMAIRVCHLQDRNVFDSSRLANLSSESSPTHRQERDPLLFRLGVISFSPQS